jgi:hypothetical protein
MVKGLYALFDKKADLYSDPKPAITDAVFVRLVQDMLREGNNQIANHPEDFSIVCVGEWNENSGNLTHYEKPRMVSQVDILNGE